MFHNVKCDDTVFAKLLADIAMAKKSKTKAYPESLRKRILEYIDNSKMTVKTFASKCGLSQITIRRWKEDLNPPLVKCYAGNPVIDSASCARPVELQQETTDFVTVNYEDFEIRCPLHILSKVIDELKKGSQNV